VCAALVGRTTRWIAISGWDVKPDVLCAECADDVYATIQRLRAELKRR
jgi:hypothetical protein